MNTCDVYGMAVRCGLPSSQIFAVVRAGLCPRPTGWVDSGWQYLSSSSMETLEWRLNEIEEWVRDHAAASINRQLLAGRGSLADSVNTPDEFLNLKQTRQCTGLGTTTLYQWVKTGAFPKPVKLGSATRWSKREISEWQKAQKRIRDSSAS